LKSTRSFVLDKIGLNNINAFEIANDGTLFVGGADRNSKGTRVLKIDSDDKVLWSRVYDNQGLTEVLRHMKLLANGDILIAGTAETLPYRGREGGSAEYSWIVGLDSEGKRRWKRYYGNSKNPRGTRDSI